MNGQSAGWSYLVESFGGDTRKMTDYLNKMDAQGWELVSVGHNSRLGMMVCVFRRPRGEAD